MGNSASILLPEKFLKFILASPENGMGYHLVDVIFKDGRVLKKIIVSNSSIILPKDSEIIIAEDIENIRLSAIK
ncbi:MAG: hypothetical protein ABIQ02_00520 [Saprospiraceae bacterium]